MNKMRYLKDTVTLTYEPEVCIGCGRCLEVCPHAVFQMASARQARQNEDPPSRKVVVADRDACMECGACARNCPTAALSVKPGVGCAAAIITGWLTGSEPNCGCGEGEEGGCC